MSTDKLRAVLKAFIESQFGYCPLVWMFHNRTLNNRINRLHERALRIIYKDTQLTFEELLALDKSFTIHHRNLQRLATEMYKVKNNLCPEFMNEIFRMTRILIIFEITLFLKAPMFAQSTMVLKPYHLEVLKRG